MSGALRIAAGGYAAEIVPEAGGLVSALTWTDANGAAHDLLHRGSGVPSSPAAPNLFGCWPMLPYANRAFAGRIDDGETAFTIPLNHPSGGNAIHGFGWQAAWQVEARDAASVTLLHRRTEGDDPWRYTARMRCAVGDDGFSLSLSLANEAEATLPYGFGFHPWFPAAADTSARFAARGQIVLGSGFQPQGFAAFADGGPYAAGGPAHGEAEIALSLVDWDGAARLETPSRGLAIELSADPVLRHPVMWAPPRAPFICFEPQSHGVGAPGEAAARAVTPLARLHAGETLSGGMRIAGAGL